MSDPRPPMPDLAKGSGLYLRNAWYVAGWASDLGAEPQAKVFLETPVALFRDGDGQAQAIGGRCPHRFAPLGHGKVVEGALQCPYHGLRFGTDGACVFSPHPGGDRPQASVAAFPLVERHALLWIWIGNAARADPATIPDFSWLDNPKVETVRGATLAEGHYELYSDNILDLSHAGFVHPALDASAWTKGTRKFWQDGETVHAHYAQPNDFLSEGISAILGTEGRRQDFDGHVVWHAPATLSFDFRTGDPDTPFDALCTMPSLHAFTPETANTTHYLWATGRDFAVGDTEFSTAMRGALEYAFEHEDMPLIRDAHRLMAGIEFWDLRPLVLEGDGAAIRARRQLRKMIAAEQEQTR